MEDFMDSDFKDIVVLEISGKLDIDTLDLEMVRRKKTQQIQYPNIRLKGITRNLRSGGRLGLIPGNHIILPLDFSFYSSLHTYAF